MRLFPEAQATMLRAPFSAGPLTPSQLETLTGLRKDLAGDCIRSTTLAGCGHPGGSMSTLDALLTIYTGARHFPEKPLHPDRDRVIVSHGHITPGVYSTLAAWGYFERAEFMRSFRYPGTDFGGHVEFGVPGVEWNTGNLGQGLSAGCGSALALRMAGKEARVFVLMGDGEQQKGQISEARRFAVKFGLSNLIAFIDYNKLQIGGDIERIMPQDIAAEWRAGGWRVVELDGHDLPGLRAAFAEAYLEPGDRPTVLIGRTVMGRGVPFIENKAKYHGSALSVDQAREALAALGVEDDLDGLLADRAAFRPEGLPEHHREIELPELDAGTPRDYGADVKTDCRSAYGNALADLAEANNRAGATRVVGLTCDLQGSVKMGALEKVCPEAFIECGIQEHHAATLAGRLSVEGIVPFFSTFGVFAMAEAYNQQRLNDLNDTNLKIATTHCGLDVGEDGQTHQAIDFLALGHGPYHLRIFVPADPNQTDRIIRYAACHRGNMLIPMGRSKLPVICDEQGAPFFAGDYRFEPGKADLLRGGEDVTVVTFGDVAWRAVEAADRLRGEVSVRVLSCASVRPLDTASLVAAARETRGMIVYEDHNRDCGLGVQVATALVEAGVATKFKRMGTHRYGTSGKPDPLLAEQGLGVDDLVGACRELAG